MLLTMMFSLMLGLTVTTAAAKDIDPKPTPMMRVLQPATAKAGDSVLVSGENLGRQFISEVYVSDGTQDRKVRITEQTDLSIKFIVPVECKPGKYRIIALLNALDPVLLEEPVILVVIE